MNQPVARWLWGAVFAAATFAFTGCGAQAYRTGLSITTVIAPPSGYTAPSGDELADPTRGRHGLDRFSAPGMDVHFLYPATFRVIKPHRFRRTVGYQGNSISTELADAASSLEVTEYQAIPAEPLPGDARDISIGFDRTIEKLTGHKVTATIQIVHGDVLMEWPPIRQSNGTTAQFSDLFDQDYDQYELLCTAGRGDVARLTAACAEAVSTLTVSADTD